MEILFGQLTLSEMSSLNENLEAEFQRRWAPLSETLENTLLQDPVLTRTAILEDYPAAAQALVRAVFFDYEPNELVTCSYLPKARRVWRQTGPVFELELELESIQPRLQRIYLYPTSGKRKNTWEHISDIEIADYNGDISVTKGIQFHKAPEFMAALQAGYKWREDGNHFQQLAVLDELTGFLLQSPH